MLIRQGDVMLVRSSKPKVPVKQEVAEVVLALGEVTGHRHRVVERQCEQFESAGGMYIHALDEVHVVHEEHATVTVPKGWWKVLRAREYTPQEIRRVED